MQKNFIKLKYHEALEILQSNSSKFENSIEKNGNLLREHELFLTNYFENTPIFITQWPRESKAFYMSSNQNEPDLVSIFINLDLRNFIYIHFLKIYFRPICNIFFNVIYSLWKLFIILNFSNCPYVNCN